MPLSRDGTAYDLIGQQDAPLVVLIHGLGLTRDSTWGQIAPSLAREFRVLNYDLCGHGETSLPTRPVHLSLLAQQLIALLDFLGLEEGALVGFSLGGMINRRFAIDHPDRVTALAILNSPHERSEEQQKLVEDSARATSAGGPGANLDVTLARWFTNTFRINYSDRVSLVRDVVLANDANNYAAHRQVLAEGVVELIRPNPPLHHPSLVITCQNDTGSTPAMSHAIAKEINEAETIIVPNLQHLGLIEAPSAFADPITSFLRKKVS